MAIGGREEAPMKSAPFIRSTLGVAKFVRNRKEMTVHEWLFRTPECGIEEIPTEALELFGPDTLEEAETKGYTACPHCLQYNQKRK